MKSFFEVKEYIKEFQMELYQKHTMLSRIETRRKPQKRRQKRTKHDKIVQIQLLYSRQHKPLLDYNRPPKVLS